MNRSLLWFLSIAAAAGALLLAGLYMSWLEINYVLLSAVVLFHGFYGLGTMLTEFWPGRTAAVVINGLCVTLGSGLFLLVLLTTLRF